MWYRLAFALLLMTGSVVFCATLAHAATSTRLEALLKKDPQNIKVRQAYGAQLLKDKSYAKAIDTLAAYANEISNDSLIDLATAYGLSGDSLNEIRMLQQLSERDTNHFRPYYLLGTAYKRANKMTEAAKALRHSIELAPQHRPSYDELLDIFMTSKQSYESRTLLNDMLRVFGHKKDLLAMQCKMMSSAGFGKEALAACKEAIAADPSLPDNHVYLAQAYYDKDNSSASERIFITASREFKNSEFVQYATGQFYYQEKNFATAVRYLTEAVRLNPKSVRAQLTLAQANFEIRKYDEALARFNIACKLDKLKDSIMEFKNAAAKLRKANQYDLADKFDARTAVCQDGI